MNTTEIEASLKKISAKVKPSALIIPEKATLEQWTDIGRKLYHTGQTMTWWLADWAAYGDREYGQLKEFCEIQGMNYQSIRDIAYVAANVELSRRRDNLSFTHHREVAALPAREQSKWLALAVKDSLSVVELRRQIRASTAISLPEKTYGPSDEGIEVQKIFLDASVVFDRKLEFVKKYPDEAWGYASPLIQKAAELWPDRVQIKVK
jgi:hypothetical protein